MLQLVWWNDDEAIIYGNMRMRIAVGIHFVDIERT
jgi:hypothetical protein